MSDTEKQPSKQQIETLMAQARVSIAHASALLLAIDENHARDIAQIQAELCSETPPQNSYEFNHAIKYAFVSGVLSERHRPTPKPL